MPRIAPSTIRQAYHISPHAAALLPVCRDLRSALNELRWMREYVDEVVEKKLLAQPRSFLQDQPPQQSAVGRKVIELEYLTSLCRRRGRGEPLQYILGTQPFGNLDLKCRPGVLIPRPEPEAYTMHLASLIQYSPHLLGFSSSLSKDPPATLRALDLCTGTGCIALLLYSLLSRTIPDLHVHGVDISPQAVRLANENMRYNLANRRLPALPPSQSLGSTPPLIFSQADIFSDAFIQEYLDSHDRPTTHLDILICNPPYVSHWGFTHQTARSVRHYEPKLAQVPRVTYPGNHAPEDVFYARLLDIGAQLKPRLMLFEVGDLSQALRVANMVLRHEGLTAACDGGQPRAVEIWRDWPDVASEEGESTEAEACNGTKVRIRGTGHGRSVFIQCK
ncbi:S-adenosyl-L-methionine-dependent methyltransferase [Coniella lustricola]|uniref:S-adenosyl-L-methionine-dependent methyltransferase n=1 Tax=Coniella lustricola TaxID=2025994 RepID=A0A2T3AJU3_9PEZI|nr:S-adenosyl-L-methionine-dependent methyltransferase [Coniella lustricola]